MAFKQPPSITLFRVKAHMSAKILREVIFPGCVVEIEPIVKIDYNGHMRHNTYTSLLDEENKWKPVTGELIACHLNVKAIGDMVIAQVRLNISDDTFNVNYNGKINKGLANAITLRLKKSVLFLLSSRLNDGIEPGKFEMQL